MEGIKEYTKYFPKLILALVLVSAIPLFLLNKGLYFSETNQTLQVEFEQSTEERIKDIAPISKIDRENSFIYFQNYNFDSSIEKINTIVSEDENVDTINYKEISSKANFETIYKNIIMISITLLVGFILLNAYRTYSKLENKIDYYSFIRLSISLLVYQAAFILGNLGLLGIISRFYRITIEDLYSIVIVEIVVFMLLNYLLNTKQTTSFIAFKDLVSEWIESNKNNFYTILFLLFFPLFFGLGLNFVLPAIIILLLVVLSLEIISELIQFEDYMLSRESRNKNNQSNSTAQNTTKKTPRGTKNWKNRFNKKRK